MSKTTGDNIQTLFQNVEHLETILSQGGDHSKAVKIISEMRALHGKGVHTQCQLISSLNTSDQNALITVSTNESTLHLIHCIIRKCEKKVFGKGNGSSSIMTEDNTVQLKSSDSKSSDSKTFNSRPSESIKLDSSLFDINSVSSPAPKSKTYAVVKMGSGNNCYDISLHGLTHTEPKMLSSDKSLNTEILKKISNKIVKPSTTSSKQSNTSIALSPSILLNPSTPNPTNTSEYLDNIGTTEAGELLGATEQTPKTPVTPMTPMTPQTPQKGGIPVGLDLHKPTIINFWADWCGYSNRFTPAWLSFVEHAKTKYPKLQVLDLNIKQDPELRDIAKSAKANGYPTVVFFCDGNMDTMVAGNKTKEDICKFVEEKSKGAL